MLVDGVAFPDHHRYRRAEVERLLAQAARVGAMCVTTAKDAVRLPADLRTRVTVLPVAVSWRDPATLDRLLAATLRHATSRWHEDVLRRCFLNYS